MVWTFDAFDDLEAKETVKYFGPHYDEKMQGCSTDKVQLDRESLNRHGSSENILRRGEKK